MMMCSATKEGDRQIQSDSCYYQGTRDIINIIGNVRKSVCVSDYEIYCQHIKREHIISKPLYSIHNIILSILECGVVSISRQFLLTDCCCYLHLLNCYKIITALLLPQYTCAIRRRQILRACIYTLHKVLVLHVHTHTYSQSKK